MTNEEQCTKCIQLTEKQIDDDYKKRKKWKQAEVLLLCSWSTPVSYDSCVHDHSYVFGSDRHGDAPVLIE